MLAKVATFPALRGRYGRVPGERAFTAAVVLEDAALLLYIRDSTVGCHSVAQSDGQFTGQAVIL